MSNIIPLRPRRHDRASRPDGPDMVFPLLEAVTLVAELLEAMSEDVVQARLPPVRRERILQALFDAVSELEVATDELVTHIGVADA